MSNNEVIYEQQGHFKKYFRGQLYKWYLFNNLEYYNSEVKKNCELWIINDKVYSYL